MRIKFSTRWRSVAMGGAACALLFTGIAAGARQAIPVDGYFQVPTYIPGWFQGGAVTPNGYVNPPSNTISLTQNHDFYLRAEHTFLWLTSPAPAAYGGNSYVFQSPVFYDVSPPDANGNRTFIPHTLGVVRQMALRATKPGPHGLPIVIGATGQVLEVDTPQNAADGKPLVLNAVGQRIEVSSIKLGTNGRPTFVDAGGKAIQSPRAIIRSALAPTLAIQKFLVNGKPIYVDGLGNLVNIEVGQTDGGVLIAQNGSPIYSEICVNDVYAAFRSGYLDGSLGSPNGPFPTTTADRDKVLAYAKSHGIVLPDADQLAIEVKAAWVEATGPGRGWSNYITTQAMIPNYNKTNPAHWVQNGSRLATLALVGMHIVAAMPGHPEMVWATFEHLGNAPNAGYRYGSNSGLKSVAPDATNSGWLFYQSGGTAAVNAVTQVAQGNDIVAVGSGNITPNNMRRFMPWGASPDHGPNTLNNYGGSNGEVIAANDVVFVNGLASGDIRKNYYFLGATWTGGGGFTTNFAGDNANPVWDNSSPVPWDKGMAEGTSQLMNSSMESFMATSTTYSQQGNNCFSCHETNTTSVSHVFGSLRKLF